MMRGSQSRLRLAIAAALFLLVLGFSVLGVATAAQPSATEYQIEAAYLLNFGKFVTWPSAPPGSNATQLPKSSETFSICVLGEDPFGSVLDATVRGEKINGKPVTARRVRHVQEAAGCDELFIGESGKSQNHKTISALNKAGVLTVSDAAGFLDRGGIIQFVVSGNKVRFEVNLEAADQAQLTLSSELLKVARSVRGKRAGGGPK